MRLEVISELEEYCQNGILFGKKDIVGLHIHECINETIRLERDDVVFDFRCYGLFFR